MSGGATPWELLLYSMAGGEKSGQLFREYAKATKGRRMLDWSRSPDIREGILEIKSDAEIEEEETASARFLMTVPWMQWKALIKAGKVIEFIKAVEAATDEDDLDPKQVMEDFFKQED